MYISDQVPEVLTGDPGRFRQIITNLVGNSIKVSDVISFQCQSIYGKWKVITETSY